MLRDIGVPEMEALLMAHIDVGESAMRQLAVQRGVTVKDYLAGKGIAANRLFLGATQTDAQAADVALLVHAARLVPRGELALDPIEGVLHALLGHGILHLLRVEQEVGGVRSGHAVNGSA